MDHFSKKTNMKTFQPNKNLIQSVAVLALAVLLAACSANTNKHKGKREVTDMAGRTMLVPDSIHRVYVNKHGSLLLYAIDPKLMVCRTLSLTGNSKPFLDSLYLKLPYTEGSVEEMIKSRPDIVVICNNINETSIKEANRLVEKTGLPVFQVEIDMTAYPKTFDMLGKLLHREAQTSRMDAFVRTYLDTIAARGNRIAPEKKVKVYYAEGDCGLQTDPSGSMHSQVIDFVGATNAAQVDVLPEKGMSTISMEQILLWNPDVILCWTGWAKSLTTYQCVTTDKVWASCNAVKNGKVYQIPFIPFGWFDRPPGTNRIIGTIWTAHLLYPEVFPYNMRQVTKEYMEIFYHHTPTETELYHILNTTPEGLLLSGGLKDLDDPQKNK
jgi:iron complex transport system substrate-binding protein